MKRAREKKATKGTPGARGASPSAAGGGYWAPTPASDLRERTIEVPVPGTGRVLRLSTASHTFSRSRLDPGSALLIRAVTEDPVTAECPPARILDLGAGYGAVGLALAARYPQATVDLVEVNARAAECARRNAAAEALDRVRIFAEDVAQFQIDPRGYDVVVTNPPIRAGRSIYGPWLLGAQTFLPPTPRVGRFYFVARTSQGARTLEELLRTALPDAETIERESGYRVIRGTGNAPPAERRQPKALREKP